MPIYEYQCEACGHKQEKLQKLSDDLLKLCPSCEKPELKKLVSSVAFRLKGSGWYETDFKNTLFQSMIGEINRREDIGEFAGNVKDLTETLVDLVAEEVCKNENDR